MKGRNLLGSVVFLLLAACGGEDSSSGRPDGGEVDTVMPPFAQQNFSQIALNEAGRTVSLKDSVSDPQGLKVTLTSVEAVSPDCADPEFDPQSLTFEIDKSVPDTCYYEYTVTNHPETTQFSKSSRAQSYVLVSESTMSGTLPPISKMAAEGDELAIEIEAELGGQYPAGYVLDSDVVVLGTGSASTTGNTINYTAASRGVTRILYSLTNQDSTDAQAGYIDVAVSSNGNNMPVAGNMTWQQSVETGSEHIIDLSGFFLSPEDECVLNEDPLQNTYICDPDGDALQVTDVYAFNASVSVVDQNDLENTQFRFEASKPGNYYVTYHVTDHLGGWGVGIIRIAVDLLWDDIISPNDIFSAPLTLEQAESVGHQIAGTHVENGTSGPDGYEIPIYEWSVAKAVCTSRGLYLPAVNQLEVLNITNGNIYANHQWPATQPFLTHEEGKRVSLINGGESTGTQGYLTCVNTEELETIDVSIVTDFSSELSIGDIRRMEVKLSYSDGSDGLAKPEEVDFTSNDEAIVQVDESGIVTAVATGSAMVRATRRGSSLFDEVQVDVKDPSGLFPLDLTVPINTGTAILVMHVDESNNSTTFSPTAEPIIRSGAGEVLGESGDWYFTSDTVGVTELVVTHNEVFESMRIETIDTEAQFTYRMVTQRMNTTGVPGSTTFVGFHHPSLTIPNSWSITHFGSSDPVGEGYVGSISDDIDGGIRLFVEPYGEPLNDAPTGTIEVHSFNGPGVVTHDGRSMNCNSNEVGILRINWIFLKAWHDIPAGTIIPISIMCR